MVAGEMEILLEVGRFHVDGDVEMTMIQAHIDVQKHDLGGGGMAREFDRIVAVEAFQELGGGVKSMRPKEENDDINETRPEAELLKTGFP